VSRANAHTRVQVNQAYNDEVRAYNLDLWEKPMNRRNLFLLQLDGSNPTCWHTNKDEGHTAGGANSRALRGICGHFVGSLVLPVVCLSRVLHADVY
jgi:hypothetical protein